MLPTYKLFPIPTLKDGVESEVVATLSELSDELEQPDTTTAKRPANNRIRRTLH